MFWTRQAMFVLPPQLQHGAKLQKKWSKRPALSEFHVFFFNPCFSLHTNSTFSTLCYSRPGKLHAGQREPWKHRFAWAFPLEHWLQRISCERCSWMWLSMAALCFLLECLIFCSTKNKLSMRLFFRILGVGKKHVFFLALFAKSSNDCCSVFFGRAYDWKRQTAFQSVQRSRGVSRLWSNKNEEQNKPQ